MLALAHGSDGAGSIRIPAAFCGVFGFKPTQSLVPNPIGKIDVNDLTANGPIATNVPDLAAMVDVLARLTRDSAMLPRLDHPPATKPVVCVTYDSPLCQTDPAIRAAVVHTARVLETLGYRIEERPWMAGSAEEFLPIWQRLSADIPLPADYGMMPLTRWLREHGRLVTHTHSARRKRELEARVSEWWGDAELWLSPTVPMFAPKNGGFSAMLAPQMFFAFAAIGAFTAVFNLSGQPSGSIPAGFGPTGLPIGLQITGRCGDDLRVLQIMRVLERELAGARTAKKPAVFAH
jgi:amidase